MRLVPALVLAAAATACISTRTTRGRARQSGVVRQTPGVIELDVRNDHFQPARIYIVRGTDNYLLGEVDAQSAQDFTFSGTLLEPDRSVRFLVRAIGSSNEYETGPVKLGDTGRHIEWIIRRNLDPSIPRVL
jgi:hypothetical protein